MILTDDDFATIVRAVELGRGLYDNLTRYVRFQMGCLFGFITSFLGAAIFNIADGVPFLPLQTLWINFAVQVPQAIGLGYGKPAEGLMKLGPRDPDRPVLPFPLLAWLGGIGLVMGTVTLGVLSWAWGAHGETVARTMGLTTFSIADLLLSYESRDQLRTMFDTEVISDRTFMISTGISIGVIFFATTLGPLQSFLKTTSLDLNQWLICIVAGSSVVVANEVRKAFLRRRASSTASGASATAPAATA